MVPSPKFQLASVIVPSGSEELPPFSVIDVSVCVNWSGPAFASGGRFGSEVDVLVLEDVDDVVGPLVVLGRLVDVLVELDVVGVATVEVVVPVLIVAVAVSGASDQAPTLSRTHRVAVKFPEAA